MKKKFLVMFAYKINLFSAFCFPLAESRADAPLCKPLDGNVRGAPAEICLTYDSGKIAGNLFFFNDPEKIWPVTGRYTKDYTGMMRLEASVGTEGNAAKFTGSVSPHRDEITADYLEQDTGLAGKAYFYDIAGIGFNTKKVEIPSKYECWTEDDGYEVSSDAAMVYEGYWGRLDGAGDKLSPLKTFLSNFNQESKKEAEEIFIDPQRSDKEWAKKLKPLQKDKKANPIFVCGKSKNLEKYDTSVSVDVSKIGKFIIKREFMQSSYSGGAHGMETGKMELYDLRNFSEFHFSDLWLEKKLPDVVDHIRRDLCGDDSSSGDEKAKEQSNCEFLSSCDINLNTVWGMGEERSSYIPWRADHTPKTGKSVSPFQNWNISYGTYAFGCSGRPGYEMYGIPENLVKDGLNPLYFDPKTKYFY